MGAIMSFFGMFRITNLVDKLKHKMPDKNDASKFFWVAIVYRIIYITFAIIMGIISILALIFGWITSALPELVDDSVFYCITYAFTALFSILIILYHFISGQKNNRRVYIIFIVLLILYILFIAAQAIVGILFLIFSNAFTKPNGFWITLDLLIILAIVLQFLMVAISIFYGIFARDAQKIPYNQLYSLNYGKKEELSLEQQRRLEGRPGVASRE